MKMTRFWPALIYALPAFIAAIMLAGCAPSAGDAITLHVKVTAHAVADGVPREGSGVLEIRLRRTPNSLSGMAMSMKLKGEAVILDMGRDRIAYFLLKDYAPDLMTHHNIRLPPSEEDFEKLRTTSGVIDVPRKRYTTIAAFKDEADPTTVYEVDPDDFAASFGPRVKLTGLTLELVDEAATDKIQGRLPWLVTGSLKPLKGPGNTGRPLDDLTFLELVKHAAFKTLRE